MRKFISLLLSATMMVSTLAVVNAEETSTDTSTETTYESVLLSQGKPVEAGIIDGVSHSDTAGFNSANVMVDGKTTTNTKNLMWYEHSSVDGKTIYLNIDLQDSYTVTKIEWRGRYTPETYKKSSVYDWWNMKIYGANKSDYSDKKLIYTTGGTEYIQTPEFEIAAEDIAEYRYIRFEKENTMGGQELYVYGYKNPASNANLSALSVEGYSLDSDFSVNDTEYIVEANILPGTNSVTVNATAESESATITGAGEVTISAGVNTIPVTVTSENGTTKTYTIKLLAVETQLLSKGKSIECGIDGTGQENTSKTAGHGTITVMNDGIKGSDNNGSASNKLKMWYLESTVGNDTVYINLDLENAYMITGMAWRARYTTTHTDYRGMKVYGANKADYSDKTLIYTVPTTLTGQNIQCIFDTDMIAEYQYIRLERAGYMGGQELYVYGYDASNADLTALVIDGYSFDSEFAADDTEYTVIVPSMPENNTVTINAEPAIATSEVTGAGTVTVDSYGIDTIPVTVTTKNGATKTYTINLIVTQTVLVSTNKPIECGIDGTGQEKTSTTTGHGAVTIMNDGVKGGDNNGSASNKLKMWYIESTVGTDTVYINIDLEDTYTIAGIGWRTRYPSTAKGDYQGMKVYGANKDDYSDKTLIYTVPTTAKEQNVQFMFDAAQYRYIRFEKPAYMGGQELYVYALPNVTQVTEDTTTTVTVPSRNYAVGDKVMAIVYNADGTLKSVTPVVAANAVSTDVTLTKSAGETAKVLVWNSYASMQARMNVYDVK